MTWIADAHREWHTVNGRYAVCPLDCGAEEAAEYDAAMEELAWEADALRKATGAREVTVTVNRRPGTRENVTLRRIRCAHCKSEHQTVAQVRLCSTR